MHVSEEVCLSEDTSGTQPPPPLSLSLPPSLPGDTRAISPHPAVMRAVQQVLESGGVCGYGHSCGLLSTRQAVAKLFSPLTAEEKGLTADVSCVHCDMWWSILTCDEYHMLSPISNSGIYYASIPGEVVLLWIFRYVCKQAFLLIFNTHSVHVTVCTM